jgi:6-phosphogluconolactonase (cycloisomerase 2 family)
VKQRALKIVAEIRRTRTGLAYLGNIQRPEMLGIVTAESSADGKFLYAAAWKTSAISVFQRDQATGALTHAQSLSEGENLQGAIGVRLSPDDRLAVAVAFRAKCATLLVRDPKEGTLQTLDVAYGDPAGSVTLAWPTDAVFSADSKFVYVLDDRLATIVVFRVADNKLKFVESFPGEEQCFAGARGIALSPDGKSLYVTSFQAGTLVVLSRDQASGRLSLKQVLKDGGKIKGLGGVECVCASPDGKFVYTCSGRFLGTKIVGGANGVSAFRVEDDGNLTLVQEFISETSDLKNFAGGNDVIVSPDGLNVYACGTLSKSVACFDRDPKTGKLEYITTLQSDATGGPSELGANALAWSPDAKFLYLTVEDEGVISIFQRPARK